MFPESEDVGSSGQDSSHSEHSAEHSTASASSVDPSDDAEANATASNDMSLKMAVPGDEDLRSDIGFFIQATTTVPGTNFDQDGELQHMESSDLEYQGSNQGTGFIDHCHYFRVAGFSLLFLLFLLSPYACSAPAFILLSRDESSLFVSTQPAMPPSHFLGFGVLWLCTWAWPNRPTRQWLCHCS